MDQPIFNVTSNNQQGGITAGQVNIGTPTRHLEGEYKVELDKALPTDKEKGIIISHVNDSEAKLFAYEVKNYLEKNGYRVLDIRTIQAGDPIKGWGFGQEENRNMRLFIGSNIN